MCGSPQQIAQPCRALSVGSNFDESFERDMHRLAGCSTYTIDPTLGPVDHPLVRRFADTLKLHGSVLNAAEGLGHGRIRDRNGTYHGKLPVGRLLEGSGGFFDAAARVTGSPKYHISVVKIDAEGGEYLGGLIGPGGLWTLCKSGEVVVDQVTVELHARQSKSAGGLRAVHAVFMGAAQCGMVLHSKEINYYGCHFGGCVEYSWVSLATLRRAQIGM